jgi:polyisoprenoid-binding protein YceI
MQKDKSRMKSLVKSALLCGALAFAADAAPAVPMHIPTGQKDYHLATAGQYKLDPNHVGVIARVSHMGFSISIFRFGSVAAKLDWDPAAPEKSKLMATVQTASIETNVPKFAQQLAGADYLKSAAFPTASFVSTAFRKTDAMHGDVTGRFTLMGKTVPLTLHVTLVGAGPGFAGGPVMGHVIGIHAEGQIEAQDFGLPAILGGPILLTIDTEFDKPS